MKLLKGITTLREIKFKNRKLLYPSMIEWDEITDARITKYEDKPFLKSNIIKNFISKYLSEFGTNHTKTIAILEEVKRGGGQWWPKIIYFPKGVMREEGTIKLSNFDEKYIYVYYRQFHCFDCGIDLDAFCFDKDAYIWNDKELKETYNSWHYEKVRCPRCKGDLRNPGLIEITNVYA